MMRRNHLGLTLNLDNAPHSPASPCNVETGTPDYSPEQRAASEPLFPQGLRDEDLLDLDLPYSPDFLREARYLGDMIFHIKDRMDDLESSWNCPDARQLLLVVSEYFDDLARQQLPPHPVVSPTTSTSTSSSYSSSSSYTPSCSTSPTSSPSTSRANRLSTPLCFQHLKFGDSSPESSSPTTATENITTIRRRRGAYVPAMDASFGSCTDTFRFSNYCGCCHGSSSLTTMDLDPDLDIDLDNGFTTRAVWGSPESATYLERRLHDIHEIDEEEGDKEGWEEGGKEGDKEWVEVVIEQRLHELGPVTALPTPEPRVVVGAEQTGAEQSGVERAGNGSLMSDGPEVVSSIVLSSSGETSSDQPSPDKTSCSSAA